MDIWDEISSDRDSGAKRLVAEYGDRLFTAAYRIVQNESEAEDLTFRTFERVILKIDQYDGRSRFFSWLYSVMLNFRRMDLRRKGANSLVFDGDIPDTEDPMPDPGETSAITDDADAVRNAIARLPEPLRTVVVLHYFDDLPLSEIGKVLLVPLGTVKFRLHRARRELLKDISQTISCETSSNIM